MSRAELLTGRDFVRCAAAGAVVCDVIWSRGWKHGIL